MPTLDQFNAAIAKVTGGTISGNGVPGNAGITLTLMNSVMKLPIGGWLTRRHAAAGFGEAAAYWTSSKGSNTAPWKVDINNSSASNTGANWADAAWAIAGTLHQEISLTGKNTAKRDGPQGSSLFVSTAKKH